MAQDGVGLVMEPQGRQRSRPCAGRGGRLGRNQATAWPPQTHDLYVLDEFTYPINWGWVDIADVTETLAGRPGHQHVVVTGRGADPKLMDIADLVTEMKKVKHPMDAGQKGQRGIEW